MTFFEAAVEVLRRTGRPLHYKKITEVAVRDNLLSHVGKAPGDTMSSRLTQEIKRQGKSVIVETRPGVYTIREGEMDTLNEKAKEREEKEKRRRSSRPEPSDNQQAEQAETKDARDEDDSDDEPKRRRRRSRRDGKRSNGNKRNKGSKGNRSKGNRSKGNRSKGNKRSKGNRRSKNQKSSKGSGGRRRARGSRRSGGSKSSKSSNGNKRSTKGNRRSQDANGNRRSKNDQNNGRRSSRSRASKGKSKQRTGAVEILSSPTKHLEAGPVRLDGIAEAAYTVLQDGDTKPMDIQTLADEIFNRKLVKFHTHDAAATVRAALANDNQIRHQRGHRELFTRYDKQNWGLSEWSLPDAAIQKEQTILSLSEEIRQDTLEHLGEALIDVQDEALEHIALTLLERLGYQNIKVSKRSSSGDVYFTADWRQGLADVRVCIQVTLEGEDELGSDAVSALRETLHHYSAAEGLIIHLGDISNKAVTESRQDDKAPITLIDRETFVELLIKHGIGVQAYTTPILMVDTAFIDMLKS
ncbi:MAG: HTH domain-containing protein [Persicimonas sp.]